MKFITHCTANLKMIWDAWDAEIIRDSLTIRFREPRVLFEIGQAKLKPKFQNILKDFFPRYIRILNSGFEEEISEIRNRRTHLI